MSIKQALIEWLQDAPQENKFSLWEKIKNNYLFLGFTKQDSNQISSFLHSYHIPVNSAITNITNLNNYAYFVINGEINVINNGVEKTYKVGEVGNLLAFVNFDQAVDVNSRDGADIIIFDVLAFSEQYKKMRIYNKIMQNLSILLSTRLRSNEIANSYLTLEILLKQVVDSQTRFELTQFIFYILLGLSINVIMADLIDPGQKLIYHRILLSVSILGVVALIMTPKMLQAHFTHEEYGISIDKWYRSILESLWATVALIIVITFYKYLWLKHYGLWDVSNLLGFKFGIGDNFSIQEPIVLTSVFFYMLLAPIQELLVRSGLQVPLYNLLDGEDNKRLWLSIIISNILFAAFQANTTLSWLMLVFIPGIVWGRLFHRHKSLLGVSLSHMLFGIYSYYILDITFILR